MLQAVTPQGQKPTLILSGGNAGLIQQALAQQDYSDSSVLDGKKTVTITATIVDNLVLQGLYLLAQPAMNNNS